MKAHRISTILVIVLVAGCGRSKKSDPVASAKVKVTPDTAEIIEEREPSLDTPLPTPDEIPDAIGQTESEQADGDPTDKTNPVSTEPVDLTVEQTIDSESSETDDLTREESVIQQRVPAHYRLWLPTSAGPALIDLDLFVDNQPLRQAFDQKLELVLGELTGDDKSDPTSQLTWERLLERVASDPTTFGQASSQVSRQERGLIKRFDRNQNTLVDEDELVRFLYREAKFASEFRLFGTDAFRWSNRSGSKLFAAIDRDGDRKLSRAEIDLAAQSLLRYVDQDADGCISLTESTIQLPSNEDAWQSSRSNRQGNVAMDLSGYVNWSNLSYAMGGMLKANQVFNDSIPVATLDQNQDQWISADEAESVLDVDTAIYVTGRFDSIASGVQVSVENDTKPFGPVQQSGPARAWITTPRLQIGIVLIDTPPSQNRIPRAAFDQLDANNDGTIDESEIPDGAQSQLPLESLDENGDGKLTFMEINQAIKQSESIWNYQVRGRAAEHPDGVFAWLDHNHDQFLSSREIHSAKERLETLLEEQESIRPTDIPDTFVVQLGRGEPGQDMTRFQFKREMIQSEDLRPPWAIRMDANRDGEISESEFIGPIDAYEQLDRNDDHFLTADEISVTDTPGPQSDG